MKNILITYHTGSGSTRTISEILKENLCEIYNVDLSEITLDFDYTILKNYDMVIFGFPTYACDAPKTVQEVIEAMPVFEKPIKAYAFATYALYQENCLRHFIQKAAKKNIQVADHAGIRGPASDGALLFPENLKFMYAYEKNIKEKIAHMCNSIKSLADNDSFQANVPDYKWYAPLNRLLLYFGEKQYESLKKEINILEDRCVNCNLCVNNCQRHALKEDDGKPSFDNQSCEFCLKCIHNCPKNAIIISEKSKDKKRLNKAFYKEKKQEILEQ